MDRSLMLVTALTVIGYDEGAENSALRYGQRPHAQGRRIEDGLWRGGVRAHRRSG